MNTNPIFDNIDRRIVLDMADSDSAYFLALSLKLEYMTKLVTSGVLAFVGDDPDRNRYSLEHRLVRTDSIGEWVRVLGNVLVGPASQFLHPASREIVVELTERVGQGEWQHAAVMAMKNAAEEVGSGHQLGPRVALRQMFDIGVQMRNRTRGHGAPTTAQYSRACPHLVQALTSLAQNLKLFSLPWAYLHKNFSKKYRVSMLAGDRTQLEYLTRTTTEQFQNGVYLYLEQPLRVKLLFTDPDLHDVLLPNGNYKRGEFEVLSYVSNESDRRDGSEWALPPGQLPPSETEGPAELEPFGRTSANVPPLLDDYVPRPDLVESLEQDLLECDRHPILSMTGPGGIGKTTVAIAALHGISKRNDLPYEVILWISARDIDLMEYGPKPVRPRVITQNDISVAAAELLAPKAKSLPDFSATEYFAHCLRNGAAGATIFVIDNFETVENPADVFSWFDTHIRPPNKLLITTRIRDFRGDFPIEIGGMTEEQAGILIQQHSRRLEIGHLITPYYQRQLISESDGHPYVMRIMLGEVAAKGRAQQPDRIMAGSDRILGALFERTYAALAPGAQRIFLLLASWRVFVPEVAVEAVLLRPGTERFHVREALDQLYRFSLVERLEAEEKDHILVGVPFAAALFGRVKLAASPYKVSVEEDRKLLMEFGPGRGRSDGQKVLPRIESLYRAVAEQAQSKPSILEAKTPILEFLAECVPRAFVQLSDLVWDLNKSAEGAKKSKDYLRRFLEVAREADKREVWLKLADLCRWSQDPMGEIHAVCEVALLPDSDIDDVVFFASRLNARLRQLKERRIEEAWSVDVRELLDKVISSMEKYLPELSATGCATLAWLYLNIGKNERPRDLAEIGIEREPDNEYCQNLILRLGT